MEFLKIEEKTTKKKVPLPHFSIKNLIKIKKFDYYEEKTRMTSITKIFPLRDAGYWIQSKSFK